MCEGGKDGDLPQARSEEENLSPVLFDDSPSELGQVPDQFGSAEVFGTSAEEAVREMRFRIEQKTFLTASAGECFFVFALMFVCLFWDVGFINAAESVRLFLIISSCLTVASEKDFST